MNLAGWYSGYCFEGMNWLETRVFLQDLEHDPFQPLRDSYYRKKTTGKHVQPCQKLGSPKSIQMIAYQSAKSTSLNGFVIRYPIPSCGLSVYHDFSNSNG